MDTFAALIIVCSLLVLLGLGVWIGLSLVCVAWLAVALFSSRSPGDALALSAWGSTSAWVLTSLPLFIWMGEILLKSSLSEGVFRGLAPWMRRIPGGLLHINIVGCTIFAAATGSSAATCAMVGKISLPELKARGYPEQIAIGSLAGAGTLGLMIPPSIIMIVYGISAGVSIGKLFIAGVIPGLLLALAFSSYVAGWSLFHRDQLPPPPPSTGLGDKLYASRELIPVVFLVALVLGSIYAGYATPTEAATVGVIGAILLSAVRGELTWRMLKESLLASTQLYCMIGLILIGSSYLTLAMGFVGIPMALAQWIVSMDFSATALILVLVLLYIVLGCFLDGISMVVLTTAILLPSLSAAGIDLLWFGIFVVVVVELSQITPPVGLNLFVLQGMTGRSSLYVARAAIPYFFIMLAIVALLWVFPALVTALPNQT